MQKILLVFDIDETLINNNELESVEFVDGLQSWVILCSDLIIELKKYGYQPYFTIATAVENIDVSQHRALLTIISGLQDLLLNYDTTGSIVNIGVDSAGCLIDHHREHFHYYIEKTRYIENEKYLEMATVIMAAPQDRYDDHAFLIYENILLHTAICPTVIMNYNKAYSLRKFAHLLGIEDENVFLVDDNIQWMMMEKNNFSFISAHGVCPRVDDNENLGKDIYDARGKILIRTIKEIILQKAKAGYEKSQIQKIAASLVRINDIENTSDNRCNTLKTHSFFGQSSNQRPRENIDAHPIMPRRNSF